MSGSSIGRCRRLRGEPGEGEPNQTNPPTDGVGRPRVSRRDGNPRKLQMRRGHAIRVLPEQLQRLLVLLSQSGVHEGG